MTPPQSGADASSSSSSSSSPSDAQTAYNDLKRLIPSLAAELELLRTSLREHSLWLLRYGHGHGAPTRDQEPPASAPAAPSPSSAGVPAPPPPSESQQQQQQQQQQPPPTAPTGPPPAFSESEPPAYSASDVPPYTGGFSTVSASTREEVSTRRDQLLEWLREGEDVLREYSARHAQLAAQLRLPHEDLLGTWHEAHPDNALPGYQQIEPREELMVGGVGEVPPPYLGGRALAARARSGGGGGRGGDAEDASSKGGVDGQQE